MRIAFGAIPLSRGERNTKMKFMGLTRSHEVGLENFA